MSNLPEVTKPNWSTERPTFEEVKGKSLIVEKAFSSESNRFIDGFGKLTSEIDYLAAFPIDKQCPRWAILDLTTPEEPLPYKGIAPKFYESENRWYASWVTEDCENYDTAFFPTREQAVHSWNRFVKAMEAQDE